mmetsp:Transcript_11996/g.28452  ORF Transcript_11996/g.28452 Transcript_11996/m.28452 type:complete len:318 (-) Transcript_11996:104-1057(-)
MLYVGRYFEVAIDSRIILNSHEIKRKYCRLGCERSISGPSYATLLRPTRLYDPSLPEEGDHVVGLGESRQDDDEAVEHRPEDGGLVETVYLLVVGGVPFPKEVRLPDDPVHLVLDPIHLRFQEGPVVLDVGHRGPFLRQRLEEVHEDVDDFHSEVNQERIGRAGLGRPHAELHLVVAFHVVLEALRGFRDFHRGRFLLFEELLQAIRWTLTAVDEVDDRLGGFRNNGDVGGSKGFEIEFSGNLVSDSQLRVRRDFHLEAFGFRAAHHDLGEPLDIIDHGDHEQAKDRTEEKGRGYARECHCRINQAIKQSTVENGFL